MVFKQLLSVFTDPCQEFMTQQQQNCSRQFSKINRTAQHIKTGNLKATSSEFWQCFLMIRAILPVKANHSQLNCFCKFIHIIIFPN